MCTNLHRSESVALSAHPLAQQRIGDLVRLNVGTAQVFADAGIGPIYITHTVAAAARATGADLEHLVGTLVQRLRRPRQAS